MDLQTLLALPEYETRYGEALALHTSFRIGGVARVFVAPRTKQALIRLLAFLVRENIYFRVFGNFTNVLVSDAGFHGVAITTKHLTGCQKAETRLVCECGRTLASLAGYAMRMGLSGLEALCGIPGTLGGALMMNAGAYGAEIADLVVHTVCYHPATATMQTITAAEHGFAYRNSTLAKRGLYPISCVLQLQADSPTAIASRMAAYGKRRRESQPAYPSAGSIFRRPADGVSAGKLIADAGLGGMQAGKAKISEKHAGFIVNPGGATAADVLTLIREVKAVILEKTGYDLQCEVEYIRTQEE